MSAATRREISSGDRGTSGHSHASRRPINGGRVMVREEWVRVKSPDELRAGSYKLVDCRYCHRTHLVIVARRQEGIRSCDGEHRQCLGWEVITTSCRRFWCATPRCIADGRLFRLADHQLTESDNHESAPREREEV